MQIFYIRDGEKNLVQTSLTTRVTFVKLSNVICNQIFIYSQLHRETSVTMVSAVGVTLGKKM